MLTAGQKNNLEDAVNLKIITKEEAFRLSRAIEDDDPVVREQLYREWEERRACGI